MPRKQPESPSIESHFSKTIIICLVLALMASVSVGYASFVMNENTRDDLNSQIDSLQTKVNSLESPTPSPTASPSSMDDEMEE